MNLSTNDEKRLSELKDICKKYQGRYLDSHHGSGSWATRYSSYFIEAAAEMYVIFNKNYNHHWAMLLLSDNFRSAGILSCRGAVMSADRVEYLYDTHLKRVIDRFKK